MRVPNTAWILVLIVLISVAMGIVSAYNRLPWSDEGWYANPAHNLAKHGFMGTTIFA